MIRRISGSFSPARIQHFLVLIYGTSFVSVIFFREYNDRALIPSISGGANDGWCDIGVSSVGVHCFGDFQDVYSKSFESPWTWIAPFSHPPLSHFIQHSFGQLSELFNSKAAALAVYMVLLAAVLLVPIICSLKYLQSDLEKAAMILTLGIGSTPFIVTLDRGNTVFLLAGTWFLVIESILREEIVLASAFLVLSVSLRPQAILLVLVLVGLGHLKKAVITSAVSIGALVGSFWIYPGDHYHNFRQWIDNLTAYGGYQSPFSNSPINLSFTRTIAFFTELVGVNFVKGFELQDGSSEQAISRLNVPKFLLLTEYTDTTLNTITLLFLAILAALLWLRRERLSVGMSVLVPSLLVMVTPQLSYNYYMCLLIPTAVFIATQGARTREINLLIGARPAINACISIGYLVLTVAVFVPIALPLSILLRNSSYSNINLSLSLVGPIALIFLFMVAITLLMPRSLYSPIDARVNQN